VRAESIPTKEQARAAVPVTAGVTCVESQFDGMPLALYLIEAARAVLIDSGVSSTPEESLLPALDELGAAPGDIGSIVHTHAHLDHMGGDGALRAVVPHVTIAVHRLGAGWIESHLRYYLQAYLGAFPEAWNPGPALEQRVMRLCGPDALVDETFEHGAVLALGAGRTLRVVSTPAHSPDHVLFYDPAGSVLFTGDALQARGVARADGTVLFPMYAAVPAYREALATVEAFDVDLVCTAHDGVLDPRGLARIIAECRAFTDELDGLLHSVVDEMGRLSLTQAVERVQLEWPRYDGALQLHTTIAAHLDDLAARGIVGRVLAEGTKSWTKETN
jgi:glyoxylase-like metal-dependent hydrolase (beta-lactamase superfamily II)